MLACAAVPAHAEGTAAKRWFDEAVELDLSGKAAAPQAFALYLQSARSGWPAAEFNVGVMLDSGRGTAVDLGQAAAWYARAATHGDRRAAYNLGQLYQAGDGVPKNDDLARAWFLQSELPAARERVADLRSTPQPSTALTAPICLEPASGGRTSPDVGGIELVWTSLPQPEPVRFFVEVQERGAAGTREIYSGSTAVTGVFVPLPSQPARYAWRVSALAKRQGDYATSGWSLFEMAADPP